MIFRSALITCLLAAAATRSVVEGGSTDSDDFKQNDFDDSDISPLTSEAVKNGGKLEDNGFYFVDDGHGGERLKIVWKESEYDGTREERGHELKHTVLSDKEIFVGYIMHVPSPMDSGDYESESESESGSGSESESESESGSGDDPIYFPDDKNTIVWQLYNWNSDGCSNWTAHMMIEDNQLVLHYRPACVDADTAVVLENIPRDEDLEILIRAKVGRGDGEFDIFVNGQQELELREISFGFGQFNDDGTMKTSVVGVKMGMYCADTSGYSEDEIRTLFFDKMGSATNVDQDEGFDLVNPEY